MKKWLILSIIFILLADISTVQAFSPGMRSSVDNITRNVRRQIRQALKPTLYINEQAKQAVSKLLLTSSSNYLLSVHDRQIIVWDVRYGMPLVRSNVKISQNERFVLSGKGDRLIILPEGNEMQAYQLQEEGFVKRFISPWSDVVLSPESEMVIAARGVRLVRFAFSSPDDQQLLYEARSDICCLASSADGKQVFFAVERQLFKIDLSREQQSEMPIAEFKDQINSITVGKSGELVVSTDHAITLVDSSDGVIAWTRQLDDGDFKLLGLTGNRVYVLSGHKRLVAFATDNGRDHIANLKNIEASLQNGVVVNDRMVLLVGDDGLVYGIDPADSKLKLRWVVTREGWTLLDDYGRFDGDVGGVSEVAWGVAETRINLAGFAEQYYEPGLLKKALSAQPEKFIANSVKPVEDGIYLPPSVSVDVEKLNSREVKLTVKAKAHTAEDFDDIGDLFLYHNGKRIDASGFDKQQDKSGFLVSWSGMINLIPGDNVFHASVPGWGGLRQQSEQVSIGGQFDNASGGDSTLIVSSIGINDYDNANIALNYAVADAAAIATSLYEQVGQDVDNRVKVLMLDKAARGELLRNQLEKLSSYQSSDLLVLYLSGHGVALDGEWYFLPQESQNLDNASHVKSVGLSGKEIAEAIMRSPAQKVLLAVDACQSGAVVGSFETFLQRKSLQKISEEAGVHVLTATRADQLAPEFDQLKHGLFTYTLLKGLEKSDAHYNADRWPRDGRLTVNELKTYTVTYSPILAKMIQSRINSSSVRGGGGLEVLISPAQLTRGEDFYLH